MRTLLALCATTLLIAGCGIKGPLVPAKSSAASDHSKGHALALLGTTSFSTLTLTLNPS